MARFSHFKATKEKRSLIFSSMRESLTRKWLEYTELSKIFSSKVDLYSRMWSFSVVLLSISCMRFGKKLALAMIRDAGEAPYLSQKEVKHHLVGLEKLCKAYIEQQEAISGMTANEATLIGIANQQRVAYHVSQKDGLLQLEEIVAKDSDLFDILNSDISKIRSYIDDCESHLMEAVNEWLESAVDCGLVFTDLPQNSDNFMALFSRNVQNCKLPELLCPEHLTTELKRINQYADVNVSAIRKLVQRRCKNVAECFWSRDEFHEIADLVTPEHALLEQTIEQIQTLYQMDGLGVSLNL